MYVSMFVYVSKKCINMYIYYFTIQQELTPFLRFAVKNSFWPICICVGADHKCEVEENG